MVDPWTAQPVLGPGDTPETLTELRTSAGECSSKQFSLERADEESMYLTAQLEKKDQVVRVLEAKIALYEEYERQKTVGLGLVCTDPHYSNGTLNEGGFPKVELIDANSPAHGLVQAGDEIVEIDGQVIRGMRAAHLRQVLDKRVGTSSHLKIKRWTSPIDFHFKAFTLTRRSPIKLSNAQVLSTMLEHQAQPPTQTTVGAFPQASCRGTSAKPQPPSRASAQDLGLAAGDSWGAMLLQVSKWVEDGIGDGDPVRMAAHMGVLRERFGGLHHLCPGLLRAILGLKQALASLKAAAILHDTQHIRSKISIMVLRIGRCPLVGPIELLSRPSRSHLIAFN